MSCTGSPVGRVGEKAEMPLRTRHGGAFVADLPRRDGALKRVSPPSTLVEVLHADEGGVHGAGPRVPELVAGVPALAENLEKNRRGRAHAPNGR
jgi:hypothetical protein